MPWLLGFLLIIALFFIMSWLQVNVVTGFLPVLLMFLVLFAIYNYIEIKMFLKRDFIIKNEGNNVETFKFKNELYDREKFIEYNKQRILKNLSNKSGLEKRLINNYKRLNKKISKSKYEKYRTYFEAKVEVLNRVYSVVSVRYDAKGNPIIKS